MAVDMMLERKCKLSKLSSQLQYSWSLCCRYLDASGLSNLTVTPAMPEKPAADGIVATTSNQSAEVVTPSGGNILSTADSHNDQEEISHKTLTEAGKVTDNTAVVESSVEGVQCDVTHETQINNNSNERCVRGDNSIVEIHQSSSSLDITHSEQTSCAAVTPTSNVAMNGGAHHETPAVEIADSDDAEANSVSLKPCNPAALSNGSAVTLSDSNGVNGDTLISNNSLDLCQSDEGPT